MIIHGFKKIIAITVWIAFIGTGMARASESTPSFQEKAGTLVVRKHKKFPVFIVVGGLVVLGAVVYFATRKKDDPQPPAQDVTLNIDVYNHTKAKLIDDYKITAKAGSIVNLTKAMLNVNGVKNEYLILRKLHSGETPGAFVADTNSGTLAVTVPNSNTDYDLFLLNDSAAPYSQYWASSDTGKTTWNMFRQDWDQTGPQAPFDQAIARLNTGLTKNGMRYGIINKVSTGNQANGDVRYGYYSYGGFGYHNIPENWWSVNIENCTDDRARYLIAMEESSEILTRSNNFINIVMGDLENGVMDDALCFKFLRVRN